MGDNRATSAYALAIETSGRLGSVALGCRGHLLDVATFGAERRHATELLATIERLCRKRDVAPGRVAAVYVSGGPGSFTGLRVGVTVARTLAWAGRVSAVRVPTLDVIAQNALDADRPPQSVAVMLDAKRGRVYAAAYVRRRRRYARVSEPAERDPDTFLAALPRDCALLGEGVPYLMDAVARSGLVVLPEPFHRARAEVVYRLGRLLRRAAGDRGPDDLLPIYIRRPEAEEVWERRHATLHPPSQAEPS